MRQALSDFLQEVRAAGLAVSLAESMDALRAAMAAGVEREVLREALAATIVKEETDRPAFDETFERFFSGGGDEGRRRRRARPGPGESGAGRSGGEGRGATPQPRRQERSEGRGHSSFPETPSSALQKKRNVPFSPPSAEVLRRRRQRALLRKPFRELDPAEGEELAMLASELARRFRARWARRRCRGRRGRLDFRRTLRRSVSRGGVPLELAFRRRRPGRPDLLVLCDLSGSVRHAAEFFAALLAPCSDFFRRVRLFVYIDRPVEASVENGRLVPHEAIDFHAFSDLGRTLLELEETAASSLTRSTILLVLGDARNNRRPARADALARLRARTRALWWLVPEAHGRWGTGDSALESYRPHCDEVLECGCAAELVAALARL